MKDIVLATVTGLAVGATFALVGLPVPAPPTIAGVVGVAAIALGWWVVAR